MAKNILYLTPTTVGVKFISTSGGGSTDTLSITNDILLYNERVRGSLPAVATTGTTAIGSPTITAVPSTVGVAVGQYIYGVGIPSGSVVVSFSANTSITINQNCLANGTVPLNFAAPYLGTKIVSPATGTRNITYAATTVGTFTGSISGEFLTVTSTPTATLTIGSYLAGSGVTVNTLILSQVSGTTGGQGVYRVSKLQSATSTTISFGNIDSAIQVGHILTGPGITQNSVIVGHTWTSAGGGQGLLVVDKPATASTTVTANYNPTYPFPTLDLVSAVSSCSGSGGSGLTIDRFNGTTYTAVMLSPATNTAQFEFDFSQTQLKENVLNTQDVRVTLPAGATLYLTFRKPTGFETAVNFEQFGSYEDVTSFTG